MKDVENDKGERHKAVKGWAEILYRAEYADNFPDGTVVSFQNVSETDYNAIPSWFPTQEYVFTWELLEPFCNGRMVSSGLVERNLRPYDAITLCVYNPVPSLTTLLVIPVSHVAAYASTQKDPRPNVRGDLALVALPTPFPSFRCPDWGMEYPACEDDDDDNYDYET